jgi:hypothetical protein
MSRRWGSVAVVYLATASCAGAPDNRPLGTTGPTPRATVSPSAIASAEPEATLPPLIGATQITTQGPSCALLIDDGVSCWGGALGSTPRRVPGANGVARVVTGRGEIAILRQNGELVIGAENARAFAGIRDAVAYAREYDDRCVVRKSGDVACAGPGAASLTKVDGIRDAIDVSVGRTHSCALSRARGGVACFQQGAKKPTAALVKGLEGAVEVAVGAEVGCARKADGSTHCFDMKAPLRGSAAAGTATAMAVGDIYDGTATTFLCTSLDKFARCRFVSFGGEGFKRESEVFSLTAASDIRRLSANFGGLCALDAAGAVTCTGSNNTGELALPSASFMEKPTKLEGFSPLSSIVIGNNFACGVTRDGAVECVSRGVPPAQVAGFDSPVTTLTSLGEIVCGTTEAGQVSCFEPGLNARPARRFPGLDGSRSIHATSPYDSIAVVGREGRLSLGSMWRDLSTLDLKPIAGTANLVDAKLSGGMATADSQLFEMWLLDADGRVEWAFVQGFKLLERKKLPTLDGAVVLGNDGRVIKKNGELWAAEELLRKSSPLASLVGDIPCGAAKDGKLACLDAIGNLAAKLGVAGDAPALGWAKGAAGNWGMACVIDADGAPHCWGRDEIGMLDGAKRTTRSAEAHRIPLRALP